MVGSLLAKQGGLGFNGAKPSVGSDRAELLGSPWAGKVDPSVSANFRGSEVEPACCHRKGNKILGKIYVKPGLGAGRPAASAGLSIRTKTSAKQVRSLHPEKDRTALANELAQGHSGITEKNGGKVTRCLRRKLIKWERG